MSEAVHFLNDFLRSVIPFLPRFPSLLRCVVFAGFLFCLPHSFAEFLPRLLPFFFPHGSILQKSLPCVSVRENLSKNPSRRIRRHIGVDLLPESSRPVIRGKPARVQRKVRKTGPGEVPVESEGRSGSGIEVFLHIVLKMLTDIFCSSRPGPIGSVNKIKIILPEQLPMKFSQSRADRNVAGGLCLHTNRVDSGAFQEKQDQRQQNGDGQGEKDRQISPCIKIFFSLFACLHLYSPPAPAHRSSSCRSPPVPSQHLQRKCHAPEKLCRRTLPVSRLRSSDRCRPARRPGRRPGLIFLSHI